MMRRQVVDSTFDPDAAAQLVVKMSATASGSGGAVIWRARLRGGGEPVDVTGTRVRALFSGPNSAKFLQMVRDADGEFVRPIKGERVDAPEQPSPSLSFTYGDCSEPLALPLLAYHSKRFCTSHGLASAMHHWGDPGAAAAIAASAKDAISSSDAVSNVLAVVNSSACRGWTVGAALRNTHNPIEAIFDHPVLVQLKGNLHVFTTLGRCIFDATDTHALPLDPQQEGHASLDRCASGSWAGVARAWPIVPGKKALAARIVVPH